METEVKELESQLRNCINMGADIEFSSDGIYYLIGQVMEELQEAEKAKDLRLCSHTCKRIEPAMNIIWQLMNNITKHSTDIQEIRLK